MVTEARGKLRRRDWLQHCAGLPLLLAAPAFGAAAGEAPSGLFATWQEGERHFAGLLRFDTGKQPTTTSRIELPTRAHGLVAESGGSVLVLARRPGDWVLRWHPRSGRTRWQWSDGRDVLNGHALQAPQGGPLFSTATELDSGSGIIQARDPLSLRVLARWPSGGIDPHALLWHSGRLWVANGGISTQPETGRVKRDLARMDSSLAALDPASGRLLNHWRVDDQRLSLRHLAANGALIGVAMQAEHDAAVQRERAPLLAVFDGERLRTVPGPAANESEISGGYGGDIAAEGRGFVVSATRAHRLVHWLPGDGWQPSTPLVEAGALAVHGNATVAAGRGRLLWLGPQDRQASSALQQWDNHWVFA